jgi:serine protease inhibitor
MNIRAFLGTVAIFIGCVAPPTMRAAQGEQALAAANDVFAFNLLKQVAKDEPGKNIFISPYSASVVLQMVSCGAVGQTKAEMEQVLAIQGLSAESVGAANKAVASSLKKLTKNIILTTANAVWYQPGELVKPDFLALNARYFDATVGPLDFADPHSVDVINAWADKKTHGKIPRLADGMIDPVYTRLFLANAVYFKGKWSEPFNPEFTGDRTFHLARGEKRDVPMMRQQETFTCQQGTGYKAVRLPYEGKNFAMYVFLPDTNSNPEKLLDMMNGDRWQRVTEPGFKSEEGLLVLPKFKLEYGVELKETLRAMGMKQAFEPNKADFSGITSQLYISDVRQRTFIDVKEEGTEAAAAIGLAVTALGIPKPPPFVMIVDRPFMFLIEDSQTGTILFMGMIFEPRV